METGPLRRTSTSSLGSPSADHHHWRSLLLIINICWVWCQWYNFSSMGGVDDYCDVNIGQILINILVNNDQMEKHDWKKTQDVWWRTMIIINDTDNINDDDLGDWVLPMWWWWALQQKRWFCRALYPLKHWLSVWEIATGFGIGKPCPTSDRCVWSVVSNDQTWEMIFVKHFCVNTEWPVPICLRNCSRVYNWPAL